MKSRTRVVTLVTVFLSVLPASASEQTSPKCTDKAQTLSEEWALANLDCGVDTLLQSGADALSEIGLDVASSAQNFYAPGIASLLFDGDLLKAQMDKLQRQIEERARMILDQLEPDRVENLSDSLTSVHHAWESYRVLPLEELAVVLDTLLFQESQLKSMSLGLMWPKNKQFDLDFGELVPADVDRFHHVILLTAFQVQFMTMRATVQAFAAQADSRPSSPTQYQFLKAQERALVLTKSAVETFLGYMTAYLVSLSSKDLFRKRSDERITQNGFSPCPGIADAWVRKSAIGKDPNSPEAQVWTFAYRGDGVQWTPSMPTPVCYGTPGAGGAYRIVAPDGTVTTGRATWASVHQVWNPLVDSVKQQAYLDFLLAAYGTALPALMQWYHQVGSEPPALAIDADLSDAIRRVPSSRLLLDALDGAVDALSATDIKAAESIILQHGNAHLYYLLLGAGADFLSGGLPYPTANVRPVLYGDVDFGHFGNVAAAKFSTISAPMLY